MNSEHEKLILLHILKNPKYFKTINQDHFEHDEIGLLFSLSKKFYDRFNESPSKEQLIAVSKKDQFKDKLDDGIINVIFAEPYESYEQEWIKNTVESWILFKNLEMSLTDVIQMIKTTKINPDNIGDVINKAKIMFNDRNAISFNDKLGLNFFDPVSHKINEEDKITTNHNFMDQLSGGYFTKSLVVYVGEQNIGKSIWLANDVVNYVKAGHNVAAISAEMSDKQYIHRIGANLLNVNINDYQSFANDPERMKGRLSSLTQGVNPPGSLFVKEFPTSQASVLDIEAYLRQEEAVNGIKFRVVVIDYINILQNYRNPNTENTYLKIKQIAEDLRAMAARNNWLVITATQVNRSGMDTSDYSMTSVSESAGLGFTADVVYGIIQDNQMYLERTYWLKVLKIRNGGGKFMKCKYNINYEFMRLSETDETVVPDQI